MDCSAEEDIELSTATARKYSLSLEVVDLHQEYWENVAAYAIDKIQQGIDTESDVMCNKLIKFGCFETACQGKISTLRQPVTMPPPCNVMVKLGWAQQRSRERSDRLSRPD